jgi:NAD(P)-dependent dehydrogenase (short-subunit alcohol dehydrogenase family)
MIEKKVIFITGAFGLIGYSLSKFFLRNNYCVVLSDIEHKKIDFINSDLINKEKLNPDFFLLLKLDITCKKSINKALELSIKKFSKVDVLVNNAAIDAKFDKNGFENIDNNSFENYPIDLLEKSIKVNTVGMVLITQLFCKQMLSQGFGNIINVASTYALISPNQNLYDYNNGKNIKYKPVDYIVSKSFIPNFTRYIATFYAKKNIRCNAIAPHGILNNHDENFLKNFSELSPIGRMCEVEELHGAFKFLADDESKYMTGSILVIDGGWTAW